MTTAKLFKNGQSQAVRLPKEFRFMGEHVNITKMGNGVLLTPCHEDWSPLLTSLELFPDDVDFVKDEPDINEKDLFK